MLGPSLANPRREGVSYVPRQLVREGGLAGLGGAILSVVFCRWEKPTVNHRAVDEGDPRDRSKGGVRR